MNSPSIEKMHDWALKPGMRFDFSTLSKDPLIVELMKKSDEQDQARKNPDWAALCYYKTDNAAQASKARPQVVFMGDSITENWQFGDRSLFSASVLDRGISGQTTSQILLRFYDDVAALHRSVVHLMAGTNDVAQNAGPISDEDILNNIRDCLDFMFPLGEKQMRRILAEWVAHFNQGRPHLSLGPGIPEPVAVFLLLQGHERHSLPQDCQVAARAVLGDLCHEYRGERIAA
jgi:hypothetical protein